MDRFSQWRPHPWHGLSPGVEPPHRVTAFIEITPFDFVKYEIDKDSGYLRIDRPQRTSSLPPALYGFIPRTYAGARVGGLMPGASGGDGDPLDICVLSERLVAKSEVLVATRVVGGIPMLDDGHADDKIIAVLENDPLWDGFDDLAHIPGPYVERLTHYFATYKMIPGKPLTASVGAPYGKAHAEAVIQAALDDYREAFPVP